MILTAYTVLTPYGTFEAQWDEDEEIPVAYVGDQGAIDFFRAYLDLSPVSGRGGARLSPDTLEPVDLYGFCQSESADIIVLPDDVDLIDDATGDDDEALADDDSGTGAGDTPSSDSDTSAPLLDSTAGGATPEMPSLDEDADTFFDDLARARDGIQAMPEPPAKDE